MIPRAIASFLTALLGGLLLQPLTARAWDPVGHMLVAQIAYDEMTPAAKEKFIKAASDLNDQFTPYNPVTAAAWMDDIKSNKEKYLVYSKWHYIDWPLTVPSSEWKPGAPPHILDALALTLGMIKGAPGDPKLNASQAYAMLVHMVGDIHQPLHCSDRDDKGGNKVTIGPIPGLPAKYCNLHAFWDSAYRYDVKDGAVIEMYPCLWDAAGRPSAPGEGFIAERARELVKEFDAPLAKDAKVDDFEAWARETHQLGMDAAYAGVPVPASKDDVFVMPALYVSTGHQVAGRQMVKAGHRLAALLNSLAATP